MCIRDRGNRILRSYILVERALIEGILCHIAGHDLVDLQCAGCLIKGAVLKLNLNGCLELIRGIGPSAVHDNALQRFYLIGANNKIIKSDPFECHCFDPIRTSFDIFTLIVFFIIRARLVFIVGVGDMLGICFVVFILSLIHISFPIILCSTALKLLSLKPAPIAMRMRCWRRSGTLIKVPRTVLLRLPPAST